MESCALSGVTYNTMYSTSRVIEKALAASNRGYALAQGRMVLEERTSVADLPAKRERAYLGRNGAVASDWHMPSCGDIDPYGSVSVHGHRRCGACDLQVGRNAMSGPARELACDANVQKVYLGL